MQCNQGKRQDILDDVLDVVTLFRLITSQAMMFQRCIEQAKLQAISTHTVYAVLTNRSAWCQLALVDDVIAIIATAVAMNSNKVRDRGSSLQGGPSWST